MGLKTETISVKVSPEEKELIKKLADEQDQTVSKFLYRRIVEKLGRKSNGRDSSKSEDY